MTEAARGNVLHKGRVIVGGKTVNQGEAKKADDSLFVGRALGTMTNRVYCFADFKVASIDARFRLLISDATGYGHAWGRDRQKPW
jgi:hypothetical protein